MNESIARALSDLPPDARVLDCGGWYRPLLQATHVADLMPYETRGGALHLEQLPGERFTKDTWFQTDFLAINFRLPFADKTFAFSYCSHTIEDLVDPSALLKELIRVSDSGALVTPSRLSEQTAGIGDRMSSRQGHPHHYWIVESENDEPLFSHKADSLSGRRWRTAIPLSLTERISSRKPAMLEWSYLWQGSFKWRIERGPAACLRAIAFAQSMRVARRELIFDWMTRKLRRMKYASLIGRATSIAVWWRKMVQLSKPYSRLPLQ
jgi:hypothetical protein